MKDNNQIILDRSKYIEQFRFYNACCENAMLSDDTEAAQIYNVACLILGEILGIPLCAEVNEIQREEMQKIMEAEGTEIKTYEEYIAPLVMASESTINLFRG